MSLRPPKLCWVEGNEALWIPILMKAHGITWPDTPQQRPVEIEARGGEGRIVGGNHLKNPLCNNALTHFAIIVDADRNGPQKWAHLKKICDPLLKTALPDSIPEAGWHGQAKEQTCFSIWFMPDNLHEGMIEDFLIKLIPGEQQPLLSYACQATEDARQHGARYKDIHRSKAIFGAWLAWQDPAAPSVVVALRGETTKQGHLYPVLTPSSAAADPFIHWFGKAFALQTSL